MLIVAVLPSILFPPKKPADRGTGGRPDSTAGSAAAAPEPAAMPAQPSAGLPVRPPAGTPAETVWVTSPLYRLGGGARGGGGGEAGGRVRRRCGGRERTRLKSSQ